MLLLSAGTAVAAYTLEVRNGTEACVNAVVSHAVTRDWADAAATHTLAEITADGRASFVPLDRKSVV